MEFGEVFKLEADGPYTHIFFKNGKKVTTAKTLKKILAAHPNIFLRTNRKYAVKIDFIKQFSSENVILENNQVFFYSRRRSPRSISYKNK
jgi:hypothetical protein